MMFDRTGSVEVTIVLRCAACGQQTSVRQRARVVEAQPGGGRSVALGDYLDVPVCACGVEPPLDPLARRPTAIRVTGLVLVQGTGVA